MTQNVFSWEPFVQFGLAGLILGVFFVLLIFTLRQHAATIRGVVNRMSTDNKQSNESWRQSFEQYAKSSDQRQAETNDVLRELTAVMAENNTLVSHGAHQRGEEYGQGTVKAGASSRRSIGETRLQG